MLQRRAVTILAILTWIYGSLAAAQTKGTFQAGINYPAGPATVPSNTGYLLGGISPLEAHIGDFNGDGKPDVVIAAACGGGYPGCPAGGYAVVVYLSNGDGTFQPGSISGGPVPALRSIAVGDFNGDGKLDIAAASDCLSSQDCSSGSMTILLGNGDGTFTPGAYYPLGGIVSQANTITVGDLNSDGKADIVLTLACGSSNGGCTQGAIKVYLGNGDGSFQAPNSYPTVGNGGIPVVIGDFNKDGKPDVLVATPDSNLVFFPGNGDGTLGTPSSTPLPYGGQAITAGDFNSDGNLDVAVGGGNFATVVFGNGDGTFQAPTAYNLNFNYAQSIAAVDMNGDGKPDLIVGVGQGYSFNTATLLLNDGTGNFSNSSTFFLGGWNYTSVGVADFNGDGKNDILLASYGAGDSQNQGADGTISVLLGNGDGTMRSAQYINESTSVGNTTRGLSIAAADFNGDGFQDLIYQACSTTISSSCGFTLLLADGVGGYQQPVLFAAPVSGSHFLALGDFNHDGKPDVAVFNDCDASCTASSVSIFLNTGNGTFADPVVYEGGDVSPLAITTGDFNGDGKLDIAILEYCGSCSDGENTIGVLLGNGDGTFQSVVTMHTGAGNTVYWLAAADFNGDGKTDLVLAESTNDPSNPFEGSAQILLSNGDGTFTFGAIYDSGGGRNPYVSDMSVMTGDVNGDGKADIVIGNLCEPLVRGQLVYDVNCANGSIGVLLGNGDGTFQSGPTYVTTDANLYAISLADVNGDGKLDTIGSTATGILVSLGNGDGTFQPPTVYAALQVTSNVQLAIADLNGDGGLDIVQPGVNGQLAVLYNLGFSNPATTVSLQSSLNPSTYGQQLTFTANVTSTSGVPTGTVTFNDGGTAIGSSNLSAGSASISTSALLGGTHSITATYGGDAVFAASTSAALSQVVNRGASSTTLQSSKNPSFTGQTVTFTATVSGGGIAPTGIVTFKQGTSTLATVSLVNGQATFSTTYNTAGTRSITATYSGDSNYLTSTSLALSQVVKALPAPTTTAVTTSLTPSFVGQPVTFTATVTSTHGPIPDGEPVNFFDGTTSLATVGLAGGIVTYTTSSLSAASHIIKATFVGDATFKTSTKSLTQVVKLNPSTTALTSSLNPSTYGKSVTFTATVSSTHGPIPDGELVAFVDGAATLGSVPLTGGVATYTASSLSVANHVIKATYAGDATFATSTRSLTQYVKADPTTTALSSSLNPSHFGQSLTFTATVTSTSGPIPDGDLVTFFNGSTNLASVPLTGGVATYTTSSLSVANHVIKATYAGDATFASSTKSLNQVVTADPTTTALSSSLNPSHSGQSVTFTATVTSTFGAIPDGDLVTFFDGTTTLASVPLAGGIATYATSSLTVASHPIKATYAGDAMFASSTKSITQVVKP